VVGRVGDVERRTPTINNSLNPVWGAGVGATLVLDVGERDGDLELEVLNSNVVLDTGLGKTSVGLWTFPLNCWHRRRLLLGADQGEIEFEVFLERATSQIDVVVLGVPFDSGLSFRPGARFGPDAIRASSQNVKSIMPQHGQPQAVDAGDVDCACRATGQVVDEIYKECGAKLGRSRRLLLLGGDHTLSYPAIKAVAEKFGPLCLVRFDAHLDAFPSRFGVDVWHGSPFQKCWEEHLLAKHGSTQIGARVSICSPKDLLDAEGVGIAALSAQDVHERGVADCVRMVRQRHALSGGAPVYLSIDIDVLDPSVAPGTGTPEFGGLLAHQLLQFVRGLKGLPIVAADVVEVVPGHDHAGITAVAAATLALEEIALMRACMDDL